jgi:hypothetical protein
MMVRTSLPLAVLRSKLKPVCARTLRYDEVYCGIREGVDQGNMVPSLTGATWVSLGRVTTRRMRGGSEPSPEEVAERRRIRAERTWIQTQFADFGPRILADRRGEQ